MITTTSRTSLSMPRLRLAFGQVLSSPGAREPGVDGKTAMDFVSPEQRSELVALLDQEIRAGTYKPSPVRQKFIWKAKKQRELGLPTVRDRVVQQAMLMDLQRIDQGKSSPNSYAFLPARGPGRAVEDLARVIAGSTKKTIIVSVDIKDFFGSLDHARVIRGLTEESFQNIDIVQKILRAGLITEDGKLLLSNRGVPQGALISPTLSNIYMHSVDLLMFEARQFLPLNFWRYADDMVMAVEGDETRAAEELARLADRLSERGLVLAEHKTQIHPASEGIDWLGFHLHRSPSGCEVRVSEKAKSKLNLHLQQLARRRDLSITVFEMMCQSRLGGWLGYFGRAPEAAAFAEKQLMHARMTRASRR